LQKGKAGFGGAVRCSGTEEARRALGSERDYCRYEADEDKPKHVRSERGKLRFCSYEAREERV